MNLLPVLPRSERLIYREYQPDDAVLLAKWFNDSRVNTYFEHDPPFEETSLRKAIASLNASSEGIGFIAMVKENGAPIGAFEIRQISESNASCSFEIAIGEPKYHAHRYGEEMLLCMSDYVVQNFDLTRHEMKVYAANASMLTAARRAGFKTEGILRASKRFNGGWIDEVLLTKLVSNERLASSALRPAPVVKHGAELIGNTPIIDLRDYFGCTEEVFAKIEAFNPGTSIKDRAASSILHEAHRRGEISNDSVIIEATSGNTSTGLALVGGSMGLRSVAVAPEGVLKDGKMRHLKALGAVLVITPGIGDYDMAVKVARALRDAIPNSFMGNQFSNFDNPKAHFETTAKEIVCQIGRVECLIAGLGSGGTLMGNAIALQNALGKITCIAVEPETCSVLSGTGAGDHRILGIGPGFLPDIVDRDRINHVVTVKDIEAAEEGVNFCRKTGIFVGISSGAVLVGMKKALEKGLFKRSAVAMLADSGLRYGGESCFYSGTLDAIHKASGGLVQVTPSESIASVAGRVIAALG
jgi:cysteine synthase A